MTPIQSKQHRYRFVFSLRTLFVVVTVLACWLGWQRSIIEERRGLIDLAESCGVSIDRKSPGDTYAAAITIPISRELLGDVVVVSMVYEYETIDEELADRLRDAFPESVVLAITRPRH